jgi:predicted nucleic acid-binding protein
VTSYLVDTNIISEAAPGRPGHDSPVVRWLEARTQTLFLSVVTVAEIEAGIVLARHKNAHRKASVLADWLEALVRLYADRILPFELAAARLAGRLAGEAKARGSAPGFADIAIAATAVHHGLTLLTRNLRHFAPLGVDVIDPFAAAPD